MRRALALLTVLAAASQAHAQQVSLAPSPAVRCLTPPQNERGEPEYPFDPWKRGEGGSVQVELTFTTPDRRPKVDIVSSKGDAAFEDAVRAHVGRFRVPCLESADVPVRLRQEYVFTPDQRRVAWTAPADLADEGRLTRMRCVVRTKQQQPSYPRWLLADQLRGRVMAEARFVAPDAPPEVKTYAIGVARKFEDSAAEWVRTLRMPCVGDVPVSILYELTYQIENDPAWGFKPLTLGQFIGSVRGVRQQHVHFDTTQMGCPFELRLQYLQPHLPNAVGQVGDPDVRRQPLMDWLSLAELDLPPRLLHAVYADTANIAVPCTRINLNPKENS